MMTRSLALISALLLAGCAGVTPAPPTIQDNFSGIPLNGGRVSAISVDPRDRNRVMLAMQFGGLWQTRNGGARWERVFGLPAVFARDVVISPAGTIVATLASDNAVANGGGIWVSRDGGASWARPDSALVPVLANSPARPGAWDITQPPDEPRTWYVGTDAGIAISEDDGQTWRHRAIAPGLGASGDRLQGAARSVLAFGGGTVLAMLDGGIWRSDDRGGNWTQSRADNFMAYNWTGHNRMARSPYWPYAFIQKDYSTLLLYELSSDRWTELPLPEGGTSRGPFVKVGRGTTTGYTQIWVGQGVRALRVTRRRIGSLRTLAAADWEIIGRGEGIHDDTGDMGLDADGRPVMMGSDGGVFRPDPENSGRWRSAAPIGSGMNSLQITDLAGTNVHHPDQVRTNIYFSTQDNGLWASSDGGNSFPRSDCAEGFHLEVQPIAIPAQAVRLGYGKVGCAPNSNFSEPDFVNAAEVSNLDTNGNRITGFGQAFYLGRNPSIPDQVYWLRSSSAEGVTPAVWFSSGNGGSWRLRFQLSYQPLGVFGRAYSQYPLRSQRAWLPVSLGDAILGETASRIGLMPLSQLQLSSVTTLGSSALVRLPGEGSPGIRATEFDWQVVYGVSPGLLIVPDIVAGDVKLSRDNGTSWTSNAALSTLVTDGGRLQMWAGGAYHMQVTHISYDPYRPQRLFVGTRDAGVMCSADGGTSWKRIKDSRRINYVTGFFTQPDGGLWISSYGHGLWRSGAARSCGEAPVDEGAVRAAGGLLASDIREVLGQTQAVTALDEPPETVAPSDIRPERIGPRLFLTGESNRAGVPSLAGDEESLTLTGQGFVPGARLKLLLDGAPLKELEADGDGHFRLRVKGEGLANGPHRLLVSGEGVSQLAMFAKTVADEHLGKDERDRQRLPPRPAPDESGAPDPEEAGKPSLDPNALKSNRQSPQRP